jgi:hypothetical protein
LLISFDYSSGFAMRLCLKNSLFVLVFFVAFSIFPEFVLAHERQVIEIGNEEYLFVIGSLNEPVVVDDKSGIDLRVMLADQDDPGNSSAPGAQPVEGLDTALQAELIADGKKKLLSLSPVYREPGAYKAVFYPTSAAQLTYRIFGSINGTMIDLNFSCHPGGHVMGGAPDTARVALSTGVTRIFQAGSFGCPADKAGFGFPDPSISLVDSGKDIFADRGAMVNHKSDAAVIIALMAVVIAIYSLLKSKKS